MALTVETGSGNANADAYISLADCNTYVDNHSDDATWNGADDDEREKAIRLATQYLDLKYGPQWSGVRATENQALTWPRADVSDRDGYVVSHLIIPQKIKDACAEASIRALSNTLIPDRTTPGSVEIERVKVGPIEEEIKYIGGKGEVSEYDIVDNLVSEYLRGNGTAGLERA